MANWDWDHGAVIAGTNVTITVTSAPCRPVSVTLNVGGQDVASGQVTPSGSIQLAVPPGTQNKPYVITLSCNGHTVTDTGFVS